MGRTRSRGAGCCSYGGRLDFFAGDRFEAVGVAGEEVGEADGEGVGGVVFGSFGEAEEGADHEGDLLFVRRTIANDGLLGLAGCIFKDAEAVGRGGNEGGGTGRTHGDGGAMGLDVDDAFHGDFVGLPLFDEVAEGRGNRGERLRLAELGGNGDDAVVEGFVGPGVTFNHGIAGVADGGVNGKDAHRGESSADECWSNSRKRGCYSFAFSFFAVGSA